MTWQQILCIIVAGGVGGFANLLFSQKLGKFSFPRIKKDEDGYHLMLGSFREILLGIIGAFTVIPLGLTDLSRLFYAALIAGYGGGTVLEKHSSKLLEKGKTMTVDDIFTEVEASEKNHTVESESENE